MMEDNEAMYQSQQAHKEKQASLDAKVKPIKETKRSIKKPATEDVSEES
jgi:hypothetical protein